MSEEKNIWNNPEYKEWLQDIRTQHFFRDLQDNVNNLMELTKQKLFSQPVSKIEIDNLKNEITYCQAHLSIVNYYNALVDNMKDLEK